MKLSEAIRLGAMLHRQNFGNFARYHDARGRWCSGSDPDRRVVATCALGAAHEAGLTNFVAVDMVLGMSRCPACIWEGRVTALVIHLNDRHRWTRELIADWVETIEGLRRADDGTTDVADARSPVPVSVGGGDRE